MVSAKRLPEDVDAGMLHWRLEQLHKSLIADVHASNRQVNTKSTKCVFHGHRRSQGNLHYSIQFSFIQPTSFCQRKILLQELTENIEA